MNRLLSLVLLVIGAGLLIFGISAIDSFSSDVSEFFTGSPTNRAIWLLIAGSVCLVVGLFGLGRRPSTDGVAL